MAVRSSSRTVPVISKSRYLEGLQCTKLLWYRFNEKQSIPPVDAATQGIFDQGQMVGELARELYPGGVHVAPDSFDLDHVTQQSRALLSARTPLYEAGFIAEGAYARADVLNPVGRESWDLVEVKSSTEVKEINLHDLALQRFVYEEAGLKIRKCSICHINNKYVKDGPVDPHLLFTVEDVTRQLPAYMAPVKRNLAVMARVARSSDCPEVPIGPSCKDPYSCPLYDQCHDHLPDHNLLTLTHLNKEAAYAMMADGVAEIKDLPGDARLTGPQQIQVKAVRTNRVHTDEEGIAGFLRQIRYPAAYLDFETFQTAVPIYNTTRPYQQVPFQFSLHLVDRPGAQPQHFSYLAEGRRDPREEILRKLKALLPDEGSIVAFNVAFEKGRLADCAAAYPEYTSWHAALEDRFVDLMQPFRRFFYYHPEQYGSCSLKVVLPLLCDGLGYAQLPIADGETASREYVRVTFVGNASKEERARVRKELEEYCGMDTLAMIRIVETLGTLTSSS